MRNVSSSYVFGFFSDRVYREENIIVSSAVAEYKFTMSIANEHVNVS